MIAASPMKSIHSSKPLLEVTITDVFSDISEMNPKNRFARLEKGDEVFGLPLHVYNHNGDRYERQYVLSGLGILDILAEDDDGNFYVIELKKDSGYRDAYSQIRAYLDWFEHHKKKKGRKVYGIICLNNPDEALIKKVQADEQVRLFEYSVTYTEYK